MIEIMLFYKSQLCFLWLIFHGNVNVLMPSAAGAGALSVVVLSVVFVSRGKYIVNSYGLVLDNQQDFRQLQILQCSEN